MEPKSRWVLSELMRYTRCKDRGCRVELEQNGQRYRHYRDDARDQYIVHPSGMAGDRAVVAWVAVLHNDPTDLDKKSWYQEKVIDPLCADVKARLGSRGVMLEALEKIAAFEWQSSPRTMPGDFDYLKEIADEAIQTFKASCKLEEQEQTEQAGKKPVTSDDLIVNGVYHRTGKTL